MVRFSYDAAAAARDAAWIDVDLAAIAHNTRAFRDFLPRHCALVAVVKANAYGHGMLRVARTVLQHGADELAVASVAEGAALREAGIAAPILIAGPVLPEAAPQVVQHGLTAGVGTPALAAALARATRRYLPVEVEVDSGMARHGVPTAELPAFVRELQARGRLAIRGVFTHFAGLGPADASGLQEQLQRFGAAVEPLRELRGVRRHACNTLGAMCLPAAHLDAVRIGGGLYGFDPCGGRGPLALRPALGLRARLVAVRSVPAGTPVGYGGAFVCRRPTRLGLLPLGYGDGLVRELWGTAQVLVRGRRAPVVGLVSMNQTIVDLTEVPDARAWDEVTLLGRQGELAALPQDLVGPGGSAYEVTTLLRPGLPRRYRDGAGDGRLAFVAVRGRADRGAARPAGERPAVEGPAGERPAGERPAGE